ncbi:MAG: tyrosine-type recombinase/integrase [Steroidobacterales bacterium]
MVHIIRKAALPSPCEVPEPLRIAAAQAATIRLREPRAAGFPLLFSADLELLEPAVAFLHEHAVQRAHTADTLRTYAEILYDWFETLEQNRIAWSEADAADLVAYRNRMLTNASAHTRRPYAICTINHRVRGVMRFYEWAVRSGWLRTSPLSSRGTDFAIARRAPAPHTITDGQDDSNLFVLRQFASLPRPLSSTQARELLAVLAPPYDLMARWQLYTGLRVSELLRLTVANVFRSSPVARGAAEHTHQVIDVLRKGRKTGYVIASASLLEETAGYMRTHRRAWLARAGRRRGVAEQAVLFISSRGAAVSKNRYQQVIQRAGLTCGFKATTHLLRATFACMMLARLERLAKQGAAINPLLIVKVLMGHEHIETTDRYLRAIAVDTCVLSEVLDSLIDGASQ